MIRSRLAIVMAEKNASVKWLCEVTGLSPKVITAWRKPYGVETYSRRTLSLLCKALSCEVGDLLQDVENQK